MAKFRKKPVVIEALQFFNGDGKNTIRECIDFCGATIFRDHKDFGYCIMIETLVGDHYAQDGDWIIKGVAGEFYPCKPDIFEATYNEVIEPSKVGNFSCDCGYLHLAVYPGFKCKCGAVYEG